MCWLAMGDNAQRSCNTLLKKFSWWGRLCGCRSGPHVEHNSTPFNFPQLRVAGKPDATR